MGSVKRRGPRWGWSTGHEAPSGGGCGRTSLTWPRKELVGESCACRALAGCPDPSRSAGAAESSGK
eukprot:1189718-Prorocentrum_minimum.AAC.1